MNADETEFFNYMETIKPPHEKNVLDFFSIMKHTDVENFTRKLEDERLHNETLATQQNEDIKKLETNINFATSQVYFQYTL